MTSLTKAAFNSVKWLLFLYPPQLTLLFGLAEVANIGRSCRCCASWAYTRNNLWIHSFSITFCLFCLFSTILLFIYETTAYSTRDANTITKLKIEEINYWDDDERNQPEIEEYVESFDIRDLWHWILQWMNERTDWWFVPYICRSDERCHCEHSSHS